MRLLLPDIPKVLVPQVKKLFKLGYSEGTWKNIYNQAMVYKQYTKQYNLSLLHPSKYQILGYLAFLHTKYTKPGTVYNYLSGAKTYIDLLGGSTHNFSHNLVKLSKKGVARAGTDNVRRAKPMTVKNIKDVIDVLKEKGKKGLVFITVTLIAYLSLLRQSNLVATGTEEQSHALRRGDIEVRDGSLRIRVRSTKTTWRNRDQYWLVIPPLRKSEYCPVNAWKRYVVEHPSPPHLPAFCDSNGRPISASVWLAVLRYAMSQSKYCNVEEYTLHSLRRGGAQACAEAGIEIGHIREAGRWRSNAISAYLPKKYVKTVPAALSKLLGECR